MPSIEIIETVENPVEIIEDYGTQSEIIETVENLQEVIEVIETGPVGPKGDISSFTYSKPSVLSAPYSSPYRFYAPFACTMDAVVISVGIAPTGGDLVVDILKNGTSVYSGGTGRPRIPAGQNVGNGATGNASFTTNDYITFQIAQVGAIIPGSSLMLLLNLKRS